MEVASPGVSNGLPPPNILPTTDPSNVVQHLVEVLQGTLGALREDLENVGSLLSKAKYSDTLQRCARFASETQTVIYAHKDAVETAETNGTEDGACKNSEHSFRGPFGGILD